MTHWRLFLEEIHGEGVFLLLTGLDEVELKQYLTENFTKPIDTKTLCHRFHIGKTKLYEFLRQSYGCGLGEHLRNLRMEKAKTLLEEQPEMTISEIATACGYDNYN